MRYSVRCFCGIHKAGIRGLVSLGALPHYRQQVLQRVERSSARASAYCWSCRHTARANALREELGKQLVDHLKERKRSVVRAAHGLRGSSTRAVRSAHESMTAPVPGSSPSMSRALLWWCQCRHTRRWSHACTRSDTQETGLMHGYTRRHVRDRSTQLADGGSWVVCPLGLWSQLSRVVSPIRIWLCRTCIYISN